MVSRGQRSQEVAGFEVHHGAPGDQRVRIRKELFDDLGVSVSVASD